LRTGELTRFDHNRAQEAVAHLFQNCCIRQTHVGGSNVEIALQNESPVNIPVQSKNCIAIQGKENNSTVFENSTMLTEVDVYFTGTSKGNRGTQVCHSNSPPADSNVNIESGCHVKFTSNRLPTGTTSKLWSKELDISDLFIDEEDEHDDSEKADCSCVIGSNAYIDRQQDSISTKDQNQSRDNIHVIEHLDNRRQSRTTSKGTTITESTSSLQIAKTSLFQKSAFEGLELDEFFSDDETFS
jgi:hypothetical protein